MATIADELNSISVEHGYTGAAPKTIAGAIDALADTLAGTDVEERRTIAGAVKALAPYIGGGGGTELGELVNWPRAFNVVPVVETSIALAEGLLLVSVVIDSSSVLVSSLPNFDGTQEAPKVSSGLTLRARVYGQSFEGVYVATVTTIENDMTITAVRESDVVPRDVTTMTVDGSQYVSFTFDMPELGENEYLVFVCPQ